jgi:hypothetical protein
VRRRLLNLLTVLSLLLCVATGVLWIRSHFVEDQLIWRNVNGARWVSTAPGHLVIGLELADWSGWPTDSYGVRYERGQPLPVAEHVVRTLVLNVGPRDTFEQWQRAGFGWWRWRPASRASVFARLVVPLWAVIPVTAALPLWRGIRAWRRSRRNAGRCRSCGYDLRATPEKCPECGTAVAAGGGA